MLYGSLNNWKCASTYFPLHRLFVDAVHFSFSHDIDRLFAFLPFYLQCHLYEKNMFYIGKKVFGSRFSGFKYTFVKS